MNLNHSNFNIPVKMCFLLQWDLPFTFLVGKSKRLFDQDQVEPMKNPV